jgi:hypothetical protein
MSRNDNSNIFSVEINAAIGYRFRFCFFHQPDDVPIIDKSPNNSWSATSRNLPFGLKESNHFEAKKGKKTTIEDIPEELIDSPSPLPTLKKASSYLAKEAGESELTKDLIG